MARPNACESGAIVGSREELDPTYGTVARLRDRCTSPARPARFAAGMRSDIGADLREGAIDDRSIRGPLLERRVDARSAGDLFRLPAQGIRGRQPRAARGRSL